MAHQLRPTHAIHSPHLSYLSPRAPASSLDEAPPASPLSPSAVGSFVTKAKAILRSKRGSIQMPSIPDFGPTMLSTHRSNPHHPNLLVRPAPHRQATAPLPSRPTVLLKSPRRPVLTKINGSYPISNPQESDIEARFTYCKLIDTANVPEPSQLLIPREQLVRSPSSSYRSEVGSQDGPVRRYASSHSLNRTSTIEHTDPHPATRTKPVASGPRPKSDIFPLSITASNFRPRDEPEGSVGLDQGAVATLAGYDTRESLAGSHPPFEFHSSTPVEPSNLPAAPTFGGSETMMAISHAGLLHDSNPHFPNVVIATGSEIAVGGMFSDAVESGAGLAQDITAGCLETLAWLGVATSGRASCTDHEILNDQPTDFSGDIVDDYLGFGENALLLSGHAPTPTTRVSAEPQPLIDPLDSGSGPVRPMGMADCLRKMTDDKAEALLTSWRAQLDLTCCFTCQPVNTQRNVETVIGELVLLEQKATTEQTMLHPPLPNTFGPLCAPKGIMPRSRSKTLLATSISTRPVLMRRTNTAGAVRVVSASPSISSTLWEPISAPAVRTVFAIPESHASSSGSRTSNTKATTRSVVVPNATHGKSRRNTRDMFLASQVTGIAKGSRRAGAGSDKRGSHRALAPHKTPGQTGFLDSTLGDVGRIEDEDNSPEWVPVSPIQEARIPKSRAQRALYVSPSMVNGSPRRTRAGTSKSPSARSRMPKSPSIRSGLSKSGSGRVHRSGMSPSQSRVHLHGSPSRIAKLPTSLSTRSLPGSSKQGVAGGTTSPPPRPPRARGRSSRTERRQPSFCDALEKENVGRDHATERERKEPDNLLRIRTSITYHLGVASPGSASDGYLTTCSPTPNPSAPATPRRPRRTDENGSAQMSLADSMTRRPGAPIIPPRSPARPRTTQNLV